jgi:hypothetical protein
MNERRERKPNRARVTQATSTKGEELSAKEEEDSDDEGD